MNDYPMLKLDGFCIEKIYLGLKNFLHENFIYPNKLSKLVLLKVIESVIKGKDRLYLNSTTNLKTFY